MPRINMRDGGTTARILDTLNRRTYGLPTREAALAHAVDIALKLSEHADDEGCIHLVDKRPLEPQFHTH